MTGQENCPTPGAAGAANSQTCTQMLARMVVPNFLLPNYATPGARGLLMNISQGPCSGSSAFQCCKTAPQLGTVCANWAGAHIVSRTCVWYGVLELEAAFNFPANGGAFFFAGTCASPTRLFRGLLRCSAFSQPSAHADISNGSPDASWNEVDQGVTYGSTGMEYHASVYLSKPSDPTGATEDRNIFGTGVSQAYQGKISGTFSSCGSASQMPPCYPVDDSGRYNATFASGYRNYKLVWTR